MIIFQQIVLPVSVRHLGYSAVNGIVCCQSMSRTCG